MRDSIYQIYCSRFLNSDTDLLVYTFVQTRLLIIEGNSPLIRHLCTSELEFPIWSMYLVHIETLRKIMLVSFFLHESIHIKVEEIVENFLRKNLQYLKWSPSGKESTPRHLNSFCWRSRINYTLKVYVFKSLIVSKVDWQYISWTKIFLDD